MSSRSGAVLAAARMAVTCSAGWMPRAIANASAVAAWIVAASTVMLMPTWLGL